MKKFSRETYSFAQRLMSNPDATPSPALADCDVAMARRSAQIARELGILVIPILEGWEEQLTERGE